MPPLIRPEDESLKVARIDAAAEAERAVDEELATAERQIVLDLIEQNRLHFDEILRELIDLYRKSYIGKETVAEVSRISDKDFDFVSESASRYRAEDQKAQENRRRYFVTYNIIYEPTLCEVLAEEIAILTDDDVDHIKVGVSNFYHSDYQDGTKGLGNSYSTYTFTLKYVD